MLRSGDAVLCGDAPGNPACWGFLSSIGTWFWVAAAAHCFFGAALHGAGSDPHKRLLILLGGFSFVLAVDDFFLIHDRYIAEGILLPLYAIFIMIVAWRNRRLIALIDQSAFLVAAGLLAGSTIVDAVQEILPAPYGWSQAVEEGCKFVGAAAWMYFCYRAAAYRLSYVDR